MWIYLSTGDIEKSNYYKNYCLSHYPNTDYTRIINDPDYYQNIQQQQQAAENYYTLLYDTFTGGHYPVAYNMCNEGLQKFANSELNAKMEYIRAICVDKMYGHDSLKVHLKNIITRYHHKDKHALSKLSVSELIENNFLTISPDATLRDLLPVIENSVRNIFPVVDTNGKFYGIIILDDIRHVIFHAEKYDTPVLDYAFMPDISVHKGEKMSQVVEKFKSSGLYNMVVLDENNTYYGFISRANVFSSYREIVQEISED